eukprot:EG_transcript_18297
MALALLAADYASDDDNDVQHAVCLNNGRTDTLLASPKKKVAPNSAEATSIKEGQPPKKRAKPQLTEADVARESFKYTALVLSAKSKQRLRQKFGDLLNPGWEYHGDHVTLCVGSLASHCVASEALAGLAVGQHAEVVVDAYGISLEASAVRVSGLPSVNEIPHITIGTSPGASCVASNRITDWTTVEGPARLVLRGVIREVVQ